MKKPPVTFIEFIGLFCLVVASSILIFGQIIKNMPVEIAYMGLFCLISGIYMIEKPMGSKKQKSQR